ncbi:type II toxin-antitoxin system VapC family toxin [Planktothrix sp.]|jgi:tRNA(fMet)-specific endonuclease VapC|uniref:type II toxin-antitoxin system VapC family toxin n=2 Tax=Planktothrix sp. TaxID=3088171 RepID=UPI0038D42B58
MSLWVLDTDHISLFQRQHPKVLERLSNINPAYRAVTIITVEESVRGWLKTIKDAKTIDNLVKAYADLKETIEFFNAIYVLDFDQESGNYYTELKRQKIRIGTQDLKIASIVLSQQAILVTRNRKDFEKIPNLLIEDWTV